MHDVLLAASSGFDFPILKVADFGHHCPNTILPIGLPVSVDADVQEVEILERCVCES
jgi:muramoyltetrapeptide carboxypeptidase